MSNKTNERLEREARESLVAADLSAKMKQWGSQPPPPPGGKGWMRLAILLLAFGGAAWWFWPKPEFVPPPPLETPVEQPAPQEPSKALPEPAKPEPMAHKPGNTRYLALAQSNYHAPNFAADIRGNAPNTQNKLNDARQALAEKRPGDALEALQNVPPGFETDANYLKAHALFAQKKYAQAAALFAQLNNSIRYGEAAQWYGILALLPAYDSNKSIIMNRLKEMAEDEKHTFQREAQKLLGAF